LALSLIRGRGAWAAPPPKPQEFDAVSYIGRLRRGGEKFSSLLENLNKKELLI
jgi:hypothetical protein